MAMQSLGLVGVGAFGRLAATYLAPHFDLLVYDQEKDLVSFSENIGAQTASFAQVASSDIVLLAVPVQKLRETLKALLPFLKKDALVLDVCSVKIKPMAAMQEILPQTMAIVGTHPLFGPQSARAGIAGLNIALCQGRGNRLREVADFCTRTLQLNVFEVTPEEHDREAAYVLGLTHMLAKVIGALNLPEMRFPTKTYEIMQQMVAMVRYDCEDLFRAIEAENPFSAEAKKAFFNAARKLEESLTRS